MSSSSTTNMTKTSSDVVIETPEQLEASFGQLVSTEAGRFECDESSAVAEISPLAQAAILSRVYKVNVSFASESNNNKSPLLHIAKFLKSTLPLQDMLIVEGAFYRNYAQQLESALDGIAHIPRALYCGDKCIVLEFVQNATSYSLLESCPRNRLKLVLLCLASIHGHYWNFASLEGLSLTAGIGTAMSGEEKERAFPNLWKDFCDSLADSLEQVKFHETSDTTRGGSEESIPYAWIPIHARLQVGDTK